MKITSVETIVPDIGVARPFFFVLIGTDEGITGLGQTADVRTISVVHEFASLFLIGQDPSHITGIWHRIFDYASYHGYAGAEARALSAIDIALWDIAGQSLGRPIVDLLGGATRAEVPAYDTCSAYGGVSDEQRVLDDPVGLAHELLEQGYGCLKLTPLDRYAEETHGQAISAAQIDLAIQPITQIADALGSRFEVAIEAHGLWASGPATQIVRALDGLPVRWVEDLLPQDDVTAWARLRDISPVPIAGGERLQTRRQLHRLLQAGGVDVLISDVTWSGGITEARRTAELADLYSVSFASHGNSGPVNLWAAAHVLTNARNAVLGEVVRVHVLPETGYYSSIADTTTVLREGKIIAPSQPGLGFALPDSLSVVHRRQSTS